MMHISNEMCGDNELVDIGIKMHGDREARSRSISQKHVNRLRNLLIAVSITVLKSVFINRNSVKRAIRYDYKCNARFAVIINYCIPRSNLNGANFLLT